MRIECPKCKYSGNIADKLIPEEGRAVTCPKCTTRFTVQPEKPAPLLQGADNHPTLIFKEDTKEGGLRSEKVSKEASPSSSNITRYEYNVEFMYEGLIIKTLNIIKIQNNLNAEARDGWILDRIAIVPQRRFLLFKRNAMIFIFRRPIT